ncbi:hypothetical protein A2215_00215 [Candidatus Berkelbacteria bacterium RIFOXYA2_FULL_43_10]|uniref:Uncharacterized protein n=1 Tax=Candidatus Berkelbacteria bacterium RIFOXYA2_FULL_43_10 TaxID=1797472 RepID=A0A1F5EDR5_9BACT|nr:MAG: hypothetical protein A2215_00215 [Candidatus Berkelbacteria bacterium RIFOXYA2_FULL_43_10]
MWEVPLLFGVVSFAVSLWVTLIVYFCSKNIMDVIVGFFSTITLFVLILSVSLASRSVYSPWCCLAGFSVGVIVAAVMKIRSLYRQGRQGSKKAMGHDGE